MREGFPSSRVQRRVGIGVLAALISTVATAGIGVWTTNGPPGGASAVVTDFRTPGIVYAGGDSGLFRSNDNGATWASTASLGSGGFAPLATGPSTTVYATGPYIPGSRGTTTALFVSRDQGEHWSVQTYGDFFTSYLLAVDPNTPTTLYLATYYLFSIVETCQLTRSTDGGNTWSALGPNLARITNIVVAPTAPSKVYLASAPFLEPVGGASGFWRSLDSGNTWTQNTSLQIVSALAVDPTNSSTVYVASEFGVVKSVDGGSTFASANSGLPNVYVKTLCIDPIRPDRIYAATPSGVFASADAGASWQPMNNGLPPSDVTSITGLAIDATGTYLHVATGSGVFDYEFTSFPCVGGAKTLCLNNGRFSVTADFQTTPAGPSAPATAVPLTNDTGYFWFFDSTNIELVVKVLTGCAVNGHYWVFAGGLTNLGVQLQVTDTRTGVVKTYSNNWGSAFQPIQDTSAFACP